MITINEIYIYIFLKPDFQKHTKGFARTRFAEKLLCDKIEVKYKLE